MTKTFSLLRAAPIALAALATPAFAETFTYDGITYDYSVAQKGEARLITGSDNFRRPFVLRVARGRVEGSVDGRSVSFSMRDVVRLKPEVTVSEVASR